MQTVTNPTATLLNILTVVLAVLGILALVLAMAYSVYGEEEEE